MRIGLTGASGQLGMGVVRHLLERTSASDVIAITRRPEKLETFSSQGVTVRTGDFTDPAGLEKAFSGVDRLLIIPGSDLTPDVRPAQHRTGGSFASGPRCLNPLYLLTHSPRLLRHSSTD